MRGMSVDVGAIFDSIHRRYRYELLGICMGAIDGGTRAVKCYGRVRAGSKRRPTTLRCQDPSAPGARMRSCTTRCR